MREQSLEGNLLLRYDLNSLGFIFSSAFGFGKFDEIKPETSSQSEVCHSLQSNAGLNTTVIILSSV